MASFSSQNQKKKYETYKTTHQREKNKIKRIRKHLRQHPNNTLMYERIKQLESLLKK